MSLHNFTSLRHTLLSNSYALIQFLKMRSCGSQTERCGGGTLELRAGERALDVRIRAGGALSDAVVFGAPVRLEDQGAAPGAWLGEALGPPGGGQWSPMVRLEESPEQ